MHYLADLHIHSHLSRATSGECNLEGLHHWAQLKGVRVVGTGDFTHPAWYAELAAKLVPSASGLYRLRPEVAESANQGVPPACRAEVEFILSAEISSIYKRADKVRKVHCLVLVPDLATAAKINARLDKLGNIKSDGRPILGLDPRDLLEIVLEANPAGCLIPAHIWTPWFSMLGSKSGFDSLEECFGELSPHIFAAETGLSSDPPMNWRVSSLDSVALVSNSDLHSPSNLARDANLFFGSPDYHVMLGGLRRKDPAVCGGTVDLFPEEGKYHLDGHRKCEVVFEPEESLAHNCLCPKCGKELVLGVLHRVVELADRPKGARPPHALPNQYIIPLDELLGEIHGVGAASKKVTAAYQRILADFGPEMEILLTLAPERLAEKGHALLAEAIRRVRAGEVIRQGGYDGEYGVIRVFNPGEKDEILKQGVLLSVPAKAPARATPEPAARPSQPDGVAEEAGLYSLSPATTRPLAFGSPASRPPEHPEEFCLLEGERPHEPFLRNGTAVSGKADPPDSSRFDSTVVRPPRDACRVPGPHAPTSHTVDALPLFRTPGEEILQGLDPAQAHAASDLAGPLLIVAGPGAGKTRVLTHRIAWLVASGRADPRTILAVTFTNRAAGEMRERLDAQLPPAKARRVTVATFHAFCLRLLRRHPQEAGLRENFAVVDTDEYDRLTKPGADAAPADGSVVSLDSLVPRAVQLLRACPAALEGLGLKQVCVDEYQDINADQYELIRLLCPNGRGLCAIGDPDQAIYGFRGSDVGFFLRFQQDFPGARIHSLSRNYRSDGFIVRAAGTVIDPGRTALSAVAEAVKAGTFRLRFHHAPTAAAEAEFVAHEIERWLGGVAMFSVDSDRVTGEAAGDVSLGGIAVLVRMRAQIAPIAEALERLGLPVQRAGETAFAEEPGAPELLASLSALPPADLASPAARVLAGLADSATATGKVVPLAGPLLEECRGLAAGFAGSLAEFLDVLRLRQAADAYDARAEKIAVLTLHAAKGLEFPVVFLAGCEEGVLPWLPEGRQPDLGEERRLFYVGMTRARQMLYLTRAARRPLFGRTAPRPASRFLGEIEETLRVTLAAPALKRRPTATQLEFALGG